MFAFVLSAFLVTSSAMLLYQFWTRALVTDGASIGETTTEANEPACAPMRRIDAAA